MISVVREQYLRTDLCCQSRLCDKCRESSKGSSSGLLPEEVSHYLIPFVDVAGHYIGLLELEQVFTLTQFLLFCFLLIKKIICMEGKSMTPPRRKLFPLVPPSNSLISDP